jgi:hypothetical protein
VGENERNNQVNFTKTDWKKTELTMFCVYSKSSKVL